ncbi:hypothetical protein Gpo141_00003920 [Globisporangium polare]
MRTNAEAKAQVAVAQQFAASENKLREADGLKDDAVATATAETVRRKALPMVELTNMQKDHERYVSVATIRSNAVLKAAECEAAKILATADAEANSSAFLVEKRNFDYQRKKVEVETRLAEVVPVVISGKNGDDLIRQTFLQTLDSKR